MHVCVCMRVFLVLSSLKKQNQACPFSLLKQFAVLSAADDFFVRLDRGPEGQGRSINQDLD